MRISNPSKVVSVLLTILLAINVKLLPVPPNLVKTEYARSIQRR